MMGLDGEEKESVKWKEDGLKESDKATTARHAGEGRGVGACSAPQSLAHM